MRETRIAARWTDFDALGHLTHAAYPVYFDEARDEYMRERFGDFDAWPYVIAHISIDFHREIAFPTREVVVQTRVAEVGTSSVTFEQQIPDTATARSVIVAWDPEIRGSRPIAPADRVRILGGA